MDPTGLSFETLQTQLERQIAAGKFPAVTLLAGSRQAPALQLAAALTAALLCTDRTAAGKGCQHCASCLKAGRAIHPDVCYIFPRTESNEESSARQEEADWRQFLLTQPYDDLEAWRSLRQAARNKRLQIGVGQAERIAAFAELSPLEASCKVVLIWLPECFHPMAANKLLKQLEEPPLGCYFILASQGAGQILPTLLSRTYHVPLPPLTPAALAELVARAAPLLAEPQRQRLTQLAKENLPHALYLARHHGQPHEPLQRPAKTAATPTRAGEDSPSAAAQLFPAIADWLRHTYKKDWGTVARQADDFEKLPGEEQQLFLSHAFLLVRGAWLAHHGAGDLLTGLPDEEATFCTKLGTALTPDQVEHLGQQLERLATGLGTNLSVRLLFLDVSLQLFAAGRGAGPPAP